MSTDKRQSLQTNLVSLTEAAARFGVSRRTLERWTRDGRLVAIQSVADKRQRLVNPEDVASLIGHIPGRPSSPPASETDPNYAAASETPQTQTRAVVDELYQESIDDALQLMYSHYHRVIGQIHPESFQELSVADLRSGPLGQDLARLSALARGEKREPKELVLQAIDSVLQVLFWPAAADDYMVPRSFWETELGRMLALAKFRAYKPDELVTVGWAADYLGVTRPTIYRWMDDRTINYVKDDMSGRTFAVRRDVENLRRLAMEMAQEQEALDRAQAEVKSGMPRGP